MFDKNLLHIPGMKRVIGILMTVGLVLAALTACQALSLASCLANLWEGAALEGQIALLAAFLACFLGRHGIVLIRDRALDSYSVHQASRLRHQLLEHIFESRSLLSERLGSASTIKLVTEGVDEVEGYLRLMPPKICGLLTIALPLLIVEFWLDPISGIILTITVPVIVCFMIMLGKQAHDQAASQYSIYGRLANHFIDTLRGLSTLRAFGVAAKEDERIFDESEELRVQSIKTISVATVSSALLDLTATLGVAAVAMMLAFRLLDGSMTLPIALAALMIAPEFYTPIRTFAGDFHASLDAKNSLRAIEEELGTTETLRIADRSLPIWDAHSTLRLEALSFSYGSDDRALKDVSLTMDGFESIAIVGSSGSGKTTLIDLLAGFLTPTGGSFELNGIALSDLGATGWLDQLHYIPQKPFIFNGTLRDNVAFYTPDASEEAILRAIHGVGLDELLAELPQGLHTKLGEEGRTLSGGQAQRVALARAFLDERPILIFDEPTAHLDIETELDLKQRMIPMMEGKLVIFATHRLHWLHSMDRIVVLDHGEVKGLVDGPLTPAQAEALIASEGGEGDARAL